eukprot:m.189996 g.189996  ORF g.189996 m.189996 type:complete len:355 (-) comp13632_c0_seq13:343-1407(-)
MFCFFYVVAYHRLVLLSRQRLAAASALLKIAESVLLQHTIDIYKFEMMSRIMQDSCVEVRTQFGKKLFKGLKTTVRKLPAHYMSMFVLSAIDPEEACFDQSKQFLGATVKHCRAMAAKLPNGTKKLYLPEYVLPYVVHLIAEHVDFHVDLPSLHRAQEYLDFFFDQIYIKGQEGYAFISTMLDYMKLAESQADAVKKNAVCDVALRIIHKKASNPGWVLNPYPGDVALPTELFAKPTAQSRQQGTAVILPDDFDLHAHTRGRAIKGTTSSRRTPKKAKTPKKRKTVRKPSQTDDCFNTHTLTLSHSHTHIHTNMHTNMFSPRQQHEEEEEHRRFQRKSQHEGMRAEQQSRAFGR